MPVRLGSMPAYTGCGCQYKPTSYTFTGMSGSAPMPIEHSVAPRTLDGTIEALPKLNAEPQDEPTRAPLLPSPGSVDRGIETDAQLFQYDPNPEMREPAPKLPPGFRQDDEDAVEDRKLQLQEKLDPSAFESLEAPTTGLADQW